MSTGRPSPYDAVLLDFSGTLFRLEPAADALRASLGPGYAGWADRLVELGAINGCSSSSDLPDHLAHAWHTRDLSHAAHRAAYGGLAVHAGLTPAQATALYEHTLRAEAWLAYADTVETLQRLAALSVPTALVSNIGWDPRPVLERHGVDGLLGALVLSDELGVTKPDPRIFRQACAALGAEPRRCLMVGDNAEADGGATRLGIEFALVDPSAGRTPDALLRAVGLV